MPYSAQVTALWRRYAGERDMRQILDIDRKGGAAVDHTTTVIIYSLLCRRANFSIYGMGDSTALARLTKTIESAHVFSSPFLGALIAFGACTPLMAFDPHAHYYATVVVITSSSCRMLAPRYSHLLAANHLIIGYYCSRGSQHQSGTALGGPWRAT